jgi:hypothetical protein
MGDRGRRRGGDLLHCSQDPKRILANRGRVTGLELIVCSSVFEKVIIAIGQAPDLSHFIPIIHTRIVPSEHSVITPGTKKRFHSKAAELFGG